MVSEIFYKPGDVLAHRFTARQRRAASAWMFIFWVFPGLPLWLYLRDALWFVGFMSIVALWLSAWAMVSSETPVEEENEITGT